MQCFPQAQPRINIKVSLFTNFTNLFKFFSKNISTPRGVKTWQEHALEGGAASMKIRFVGTFY